MLYLDVTRLLGRSEEPSPTGIDRVELEYARRFLGEARFVCQKGDTLIPAPSLLIERVVDRLTARWEQGREEGPSLARYISVWRNAVPIAPDGSQALIRELEGKTLMERYAILRRDPEELRRKTIVIGKAGFLLAAAIPKGTNRLLALRGKPPRTAPLAQTLGLFSDDNVYLNVGHAGLDKEKLMRALAQEPRLKKVFYLHDLLPITHPELFVEKASDKHAARMRLMRDTADMIFVNSKFTQEAFEAHFHKKVSGVLEIGVAPPPGPAFAGPRKGFVSVGTIEPRKNFLWLAEAWLEFCARRPDLVGEEKLTIFGKMGWMAAPDVERLQTLARDPHLEIRSGVDDEEIRKRLREARAYLSASRVEGWGMPLAESLTLGTPVVASKVAAHLEVTQGVAGYFSPDSREEFFARLTEAYQNGLAGQASAFKGWGWASHFDRLLAALKAAPA